MRDGKPEVKDATVGGKALAVVNNAVEVKFTEDTAVIPALVVNFKEKVKVQSITDKTGKPYNTAAQLEEAKAFLGYTGDLTVLADKIVLTGTTKTFADVIAKLGDSFKVTVVNEAGEALTITINLNLDVPAPVLVKDLGEDLTVLILPGVYSLKIARALVEAKFPEVTTTDILVLTIGAQTFELTFKTDAGGTEFWSAQDIQSNNAEEMTVDMIENGVITIK